MSSLKFKVGDVWISPCDKSISVYRNGTWNLLKEGDKYFYNGTWRTLCASPPPECPDRVLVFQICNSNSVRDDNFDIYLNDVYIGAVDLSTDTLNGSVFIASLDSPSIETSDFVCPLEAMVPYYFDPVILVGGTNVINMVNTQNNGYGNLGDIGVRNYLLNTEDNTLSAPCVVADLSYNPGNGLDWETSFEYTACCPED